jgi:hypothetical protein
MSKEPIKREVEQPVVEEGWKHGLSPMQIKVIEDARGEPVAPTPKAEEEVRRDQKSK